MKWKVIFHLEVGLTEFISTFSLIKMCCSKLLT